MATIRLAILTQHTNGNAAYFQTTDTKTGINRLINLLSACESKSGANGPVTPGSIALTVDGNSTAAAGTVTCASVSAADTVKVGNITLTSHATTNTGLNFALGASDTACGTNLAAAINRHATLSLYFLASNASGVVTVTAIGKAMGVIGNFAILSSSNGTRLAVVAMASGAEDTGAVTYSF